MILATGFAWQFNGEGMLLFNPLLRSVQLPWTVSLSLRTLQTEAFIVSVQVGQNSTTMILVSAILRYNYSITTIISDFNSFQSINTSVYNSIYLSNFFFFRLCLFEISCFILYLEL